MIEDRKKQQQMHQDYFDKTQMAIDNGFYLEAIFREYAAIEGRLEVLLGLFGAPCNKRLPNTIRKDIAISHRIKCLKYIYNNFSFGNPKIDNDFLNGLESWLTNRNKLAHGFYKNELKYNERSKKNKDLSEKGLKYTRILYGEVTRLRRYRSSHADINLLTIAKCRQTGCKAYKKGTDREL